MFKQGIFYSLFFLIVNAANAQCSLTAVCAGGNWNSSTTWSPSPGCGTVVVPGDFTSIIIPACAIVTVNINSPTYNAMQIYVFGQLEFGNGQKLNLSANGYVSLETGGSLTGGTPGSKININGSTVWNGPGPTDGPTSFGTNPLPIELASFTAIAIGENIDLKWSTNSEKNNSGFEIERSSDAVAFSKISFQDTKAVRGNSNSKIEYYFKDMQPIIGSSYYRLKQIDADKTYTYSDIVSVSMQKGKNIKFTVYPNPNSGEFTADISGLENNHNVTVKLTDIQGKLIYSSNFHLNDEGSSKIHITPETKIPSGVYFCTLVLEEVEYKVKVIVN